MSGALLLGTDDFEDTTWASFSTVKEPPFPFWTQLPPNQLRKCFGLPHVKPRLATQSRCPAGMHNSAMEVDRLGGQLEALRLTCFLSGVYTGGAWSTARRRESSPEVLGCGWQRKGVGVG